MKTVYTILFLLGCSTLLNAQQLIRINDPGSTFNNFISVKNADTLDVYYTSGQTHNTFSGNEKLIYNRIVKNQNNINADTNYLVKDTFNTIQMESIMLDNNRYFKTGTLSDTGFAGASTLWYSIGPLNNFDSIQYFPLIDSNFSAFTLYKIQKIKGSIYIFGGFLDNAYSPNRSTAFGIKFNLTSKTFKMNSYLCNDYFCEIYDFIYTDNNFIVVTPSSLIDTIPPVGAGIAKIDTNLNLIQSSIQTMYTEYFNGFSTYPIPYGYNAPIELVNDSTFLTVGEIDNFQQTPSNTPNPNPKYFYDIAASQRSIQSLKETTKHFIHGKLDTAETQLVSQTHLIKVDSNLFVSISTERLDNLAPAPWNTSLAMFGLNKKGEAHWQYYMPFEDYCWVQEAAITANGGLWVTGQCTENLNQSTGEYDYFIKVAFIDSVAHWPRLNMTSAIDEAVAKKEKEIKLYPNPTNGELNLVQYGLIANLQYRLLDELGREVKHMSGKSHQLHMDISNQKTGMYFLQVIDANGNLIKTEKVMKVY